MFGELCEEAGACREFPYVVEGGVGFREESGHQVGCEVVVCDGGLLYGFESQECGECGGEEQCGSVKPEVEGFDAEGVAC